MSKTFKNETNETRRTVAKTIKQNPCDSCDNTNINVCIGCPYYSSNSLDYCQYYDNDEEDE